MARALPEDAVGVAVRAGGVGAIVVIKTPSCMDQKNENEKMKMKSQGGGIGLDASLELHCENDLKSGKIQGFLYQKWLFSEQSMHL